MNQHICDDCSGEVGEYQIIRTSISITEVQSNPAQHESLACGIEKDSSRHSREADLINERCDILGAREIIVGDEVITY